MVKREVVGAHYGLRDWLAQRVTAVVMARLHALPVVVLAVAARARLRALEGAVAAHAGCAYATRAVLS